VAKQQSEPEEAFDDDPQIERPPIDDEEDEEGGRRASLLNDEAARSPEGTVSANVKVNMTPSALATAMGVRRAQRPNYRMGRGRDQEVRKWLNANCENDSYAEYRITVERKTPVTHSGDIITLDHPLPMQSMDELVAAIRDYAGGGSYRAKIHEPGGQVELSGSFSIPQSDCPPRKPGSVTTSGNGADAPVKVDPAIAAKQREIELARLDQERKNITRENEEADIRRAQAGRSGEAETFRAELRDLHSKMENMVEKGRTETRELIQSFQTTMKETIAALVTVMKPNDSGKDTLMAIGQMMTAGIQAQAAQSADTMKLLMATIEGGKNTTVAAAQLQAKNNKAIMSMAMDATKTVAASSQASTDKVQGLMLSMMEKQVRDDPMKNMLTLMEKGEDRARENMSMAMEFMQDRGAQVDPNASPLNNIMAVLAGYLGQRLTAGQPTPGLPANANQQQVQDFARQLMPIVNQLQNQQQPQTQAMLPAPQPQPLPQPQPQQPGMPGAAPVNFFGSGEDGEDEDMMYEAPPQSPLQMPSPNVQSVGGAPAITPSTSLHGPPQGQPPSFNIPQPAQAPPPQKSREQLLAELGSDRYRRHTVASMLGWVVRDAQAGTPAASWVMPAIYWLPNDVKQALAQSADPRLAVAAAFIPHVDKALWDKFVAQMNPDAYRVFIEGVKSLMTALKEGVQ